MSKKGISELVVLLLMLVIIISLASASFVWISEYIRKPEKSFERSEEELTERLTSPIVVDHFSKDKIYLKNIGSTEFNDTVVIYLDDRPACIRKKNTTDPYVEFLEVSIEPDEIFPVDIGCCLIPGTTRVKISTGATSTSEVTGVELRQPLFMDWNRTPGDESTDCMVLDFSSCYNGDYHNCTVTDSSGLESYIKNLRDSSSWYLDSPPYTWEISPPCCECGRCFGMEASANFFYNSGALRGKKIWLSGDANEPPCMKGDVNGIYLNDNMYVFLNDNLWFYNGTSYGGIDLMDLVGGTLPDGSPRPESKEWCVKPIDLSGSPFSVNCNWNEVLIYFEDYCQSSPDEAGGVYGLELTIE